ncbi:D12 class N6 adenine-specific DNA methyltransferase [Oscillochloris trichoides DG-6]|uniref:D12 class N6 adenine-specific DNA methyltransferase n=1 Tax=Oscillochloris trichoides DG-6 TaxID=765420 RepID=E1IIN2_9CHLR|nr:DNA adenine methylase [Oscillochloris trichoides]EFO78938.1 D12 class N6 adenine-specific DNA methyltransferase [Oscillochloris trichoides DG-6]
MPPLDSIINVASVPQRSPFRYPGGKTWLTPRIRAWLASRPQRPAEFLEPFVGGGSVSLCVAFEGLADQITMVERDPHVAAVWQTILSDSAPELAERLVRFELTPANLEAALMSPATSPADLAFQTILRNRINRGGILAAGAGRIRHGEHGKGIASRWYPQTLQHRILAIYALRQRIRFLEADGMAILHDYAQRADVAIFLDPPYTAAGKRAGQRLYTYADVDHHALFACAAQLRGDLLMTYDQSPEIADLAAHHHLQTRLVAMKSTHHAQMRELLIGRDLAWLE